MALVAVATPAQAHGWKDGGLGGTPVGTTAGAGPASVQGAAPGTTRPIPGRILIGLKPGSSLPQGLVAGSLTVREIEGIGVVVVDVPAGTEASAIAAYQAHPAVRYAERDYQFTLPPEPSRPVAAPRSSPPRPRDSVTPFIPNDPFFEEFQPGLQRIDAPRAWAVTKGSPSTVIAILDTGIEVDHEDLATKVVDSRNFSDEPSVADLNGHGTHVAGIAAATTNNGMGVAGTGFNTRLLNVKILDDDMTGSFSAVTAGIVWATDHGAKVINMSLAAPTSSEAMHDAVRYAARRNRVLVAAAGNLGTTRPLYPAAFPEVIAVAAVDDGDQLADFSTRGRWVDVAAPGVDVVSTMIHDSYAALSGTSMAAPFVAGEAALLATRHSKRSIRDLIEQSADPIAGTGVAFRYGRINMFKAVSLTKDPKPPGRGKVVSNTSLRVHKQPTSHSAAVGSLRPGRTVTIECKVKGQWVKGNNTWYKLGQNPRGWAAARYIKNLNAIPSCT